uniref:Lipid desaturase domain-containing protein n=1 Tax=Anopheles melas TaxID=34690 RepID=A0A182UID0_9DIPT
QRAERRTQHDHEVPASTGDHDTKVHRSWLSSTVMLFRLERISNVIVAAIFGILTANFGSGLVHLGADTWGSIDLDIVGKNFLRPFRKHHIDPMCPLCAMTLSKLMETHLWSHCLFSVWNFFKKTNAEIQQYYVISAYLFLFSIVIAMTNQIHEWSHAYWRLSKWVLFFLKHHIILQRHYHRIHSITPHDKYFCISTG